MLTYELKKAPGVPLYEALYRCIRGDILSGALAPGEKVQLIGFGSFESKKRAERIGRNPKTKEKITIPASKAPAFVAGKDLKDAVNK